MVGPASRRSIEYQFGDARQNQIWWDRRPAGRLNISLVMLAKTEYGGTGVSPVD